MSNLEEKISAFAASRGASEEERVREEEHAREEYDEAAARSTRQAKIRKCLVCKSPFPSAWAGERICRRCKSTSAWRGGALG